MRFARGTLEIARQSLLLQLRSRTLLLVVVAVLAMSTVFALVVPRAAHVFRGTEFYGVVAFRILMQFALPFSVIYLGVAAVHGDIEDRTVTYLFVRPLGRASLLLGKWLAACAIGWLVVAFALCSLFLAVLLPGAAWRFGVGPDAGMLGAYLRAAGLAVPAYAAAGAAFGAFFKRPLVVTAIYVAGWEWVVSMLIPPQAGVRGATVADPLRRWLIAELDPGGRLERTLMEAFRRFEVPPELLGDPAGGMLRYAAVALVLALVVYARREYDSRPRD